MKFTRKVHLWIGLITSLFLLIEAVTGLLLAEPWLIGQSQPKDRMEGERFEVRGEMSGGSFLNGEAGQALPNSGEMTSEGNVLNGENAREAGQVFPKKEDQNSFFGFIRGLHEGRLGEVDIRWMIDVAAISMIILTATGIYLSIKILKAESKRKKRASELTISEALERR